MLKIHLRDISIPVVRAWEQAFADLPDVIVSQGDIFAHSTDAIVSPANSFGHMDGGIDLLYSRYFGWELETNLKALLLERYFGELPVGQAVVLATGHDSIPYLVSAPTMRVPASISDTLNVYLAFRAALIAVLRHNASGAPPIGSLSAPGLGTGIGQVPPERAARQMRAAYSAILEGHGAKRGNARAILGEHHQLLS
jgi:O-acetyl-ADP-ribose deacetylase (regulator of RNase III)